MSCLARFWDSLSGLEQKLETEKTMIGPDRRRGFDVLKAHHTVASIILSCCLDPSERCFDKFLSQFKHVVAFCRSFITSKRGNKAFCLGFTNDLGILPILGFVVAKCRDSSTRVEALELIHQTTWREGCWDRDWLSHSMTHLLRLEQMGALHDGHVPPSARYAWTSAFWDFEHRNVLLEFTRLLPDNNGEYERRNVNVPL